VDVDYTAETFSRLAGQGKPPRVAYRGTLDLMLLLQSEGLSLWSGGKLFVYGQNGHGSGISKGLGVAMPVSNLEAPAFTQLSEFWYEQTLPSLRLRFRLGKQDANRDFVPPRFPGNFVHSSYGVIPTGPLPSFPAPALGAALFVEPAAWLSLRSAVYDGAPRVEALGIDDAFAHGALFVASALVRHGIGSARPGAALHSVGAWYHSGDVVTADQIFPGNFGAFVSTDVVWPLAPSVLGDTRSVQGFVRLGWAPPDRNPMVLFVGGGLTYHGLRGHDTIGIGAGQAHLVADATTRPHTESFAELFYKARLSAWFSVEPDLQLVRGSSSRPAATALVGGLRVKLKL
jgi:carbohydrate-selective porin OprB